LILQKYFEHENLSLWERRTILLKHLLKEVAIHKTQLIYTIYRAILILEERFDDQITEDIIKICVVYLNNQFNFLLPMK
jgi:hypothetical protein